MNLIQWIILILLFTYIQKREVQEKHKQLQLAYQMNLIQIKSLDFGRNNSIVQVVLYQKMKIMVTRLQSDQQETIDNKLQNFQQKRVLLYRITQKSMVFEYIIYKIFNQSLYLETNEGLLRSIYIIMQQAKMLPFLPKNSIYSTQYANLFGQQTSKESLLLKFGELQFVKRISIYKTVMNIIKWNKRYWLLVQGSSSAYFTNSFACQSFYYSTNNYYQSSQGYCYWFSYDQLYSFSYLDSIYTILVVELFEVPNVKYIKATIFNNIPTLISVAITPSDLDSKKQLHLSSGHEDYAEYDQQTIQIAIAPDVNREP